MNKLLLGVVLCFFLVPSALAASEIVYRIDDITLQREDLATVYRAIIVATKYNIRFDLAVMASYMQNGPDPAVAQLIFDNPDRVRVVAHGWDHRNPTCPSKYGEFYEAGCAVPYEVQLERMGKMQGVFNKYRYPDAMNILYLPGSKYDNNTIRAAQERLYGVMTIYPRRQSVTHCENVNGLSLDSAQLAIPQTTTVSAAELQQQKSDLNYLKSIGACRVYVVMHPQNARTQKGLEAVVKVLR